MAAEGVLIIGVTEILKRLSMLVAKEIGLSTSGVKNELSKLKKTLDMILAVMDDAEKKQVKNRGVILWLEELKDIAYEAENIFDEVAYEVSRQRNITRKRDEVSNFLSKDSNPILLRHRISHEIKHINKKLIKHVMLNRTLGLQILELHRGSGLMDLDEIWGFRETDSSIRQYGIIGREDDKSNIIDILLRNNPHNQDQNFQVIPIVGMGGVGKTTLAQLVYNDNTVKRNFELIMWVCVSDDFDVKKLFVKMIESITHNKCVDVSPIDVLALKLQQLLSGKKYLLVLDDVWNNNKEEWIKLRRPLLVGGNGSKIIVTTRSVDVASVMGGKPYSYKLRVLDEDESWSLFHKRTFGCLGGPVETPTMTTIGKMLVERCGGLPLAIIVLVSLLGVKAENEWSKIWDQSYDERESEIFPTLKLSYLHLSSHLKQCFMSYSSFYPKGCTFYKKHMIQLWMAEGFLPQPSENDDISMEEVGNTYFNSLLCNSFFQDVEKSIEKSDIEQEVLSFKMHDLIQDLAKDVAGDYESLVVEVHENMESIPDVHRLGLMNFNDGMSKAVSKAWQDKTKLRMLLINGTIKKIEKNAFDGIERLRVLDLHEAPNIEEIPSFLIGNLKHLRYLDLSYTKITNLPESVTRLYHLQTLRLIYCVNLKELPKSIGNLINLRHLYLPNDIKMPREIGQLSSLRTVYPFKVVCNNEDKEKIGSGCGIEVLERLNLLNGELSIVHLRNVTSEIDAQRANLKGKKDLNQIFLSWHTYGSAAREDDCEYNKDEVVLEALQPHPNLKKLVIDQYFGAKLPQWMGDLSCLPNLVHLALNNCTKCEQLVGFGKLPSLKVLRLENMDGIKCLGNEFYDNNFGGGGSSSSSSSSTSEVVLFPSLKELVLSKMASLEEWVNIPPSTPNVAYSCFPFVEKIKIEGCPNLKSTPTCFPSLKTLFLKEINERGAGPLITTNLNSLVDFQFDENLRA